MFEKFGTITLESTNQNLAFWFNNLSVQTYHQLFQNTKSFFLSFSWGNVFGLICKVLRILPTHAFLIKVKQKCVNNWQINFFQFFFINHCLTDCYKIKVQVRHFSRVNIVNESHFRSAINEKDKHPITLM